MWTLPTLVGKVMSLLFNRLPRFVIVFLLKNKHLLISWLQSPSAVVLECKKIKSVTVFIVSLSIYHEVMELDAMIFVFFLMLSFKSDFPLSSLTFSQRLYSSSSLSRVRVMVSGYLRLLTFLLAILIPGCVSSSAHFS